MGSHLEILTSLTKMLLVKLVGKHCRQDVGEEQPIESVPLFPQERINVLGTAIQKLEKLKRKIFNITRNKFE